MADLSRILKEIIFHDFTPGITLVDEVWDKCAGSEYAGKLHPLYLKSGRLTVKCDSSSSLFEARRKKFEIIDRLNDYLGPGTVKDIYFKQ